MKKRSANEVVQYLVIALNVMAIILMAMTFSLLETRMKLQKAQGEIVALRNQLHALENPPQVK